MNSSTEGSSEKLWILFQTVYITFWNSRKTTFWPFFFFPHNYTGFMQCIKHKSGEEFAYFVCQLQTCARTIYRNSRTWSQKIYLLSPQKCLILNENWWEETKEQKSWEQSLCSLSATDSRESLWRYKKIWNIFCTTHSLLVVAAKVLGAFCQKRSCLIKTYFLFSPKVRLLTLAEESWCCAIEEPHKWITLWLPMWYTTDVSAVCWQM